MRSGSSYAWCWREHTEMDHRPFDATHVAKCADCQASAALQAMDVDLERVWQSITDHLPEEDQMATQPEAMNANSMAMRSPWAPGSGRGGSAVL